MLNFVKVDTNNISLLKQFLDSVGDSLTTFRYFDKRNINVIEKHHCTYLIVENEIPVCYGHLDNDNGTTWLGMATAIKFKNKGYGNMMINKLLEEAKSLHIKEIFLTVDKINVVATNLYEKHGFTKAEEKPTYYLYILQV